MVRQERIESLNGNSYNLIYGKYLQYLHEESPILYILIACRIIMWVYRLLWVISVKY